ncbi:MAG: hypothetical protein ABIN74_10005 [Ferruginibacter sp.]
MQTTCLFCGSMVQLVFVHGHYQCPSCKTNALPCCDGDNCNNAFITKAGKADLLENEEENCGSSTIAGKSLFPQ